VKEIQGVVSQPAITAKFADLGGEARVEGPDAFRTWLAKATDEFGGIVRKNNIKPE